MLSAELFSVLFVVSWVLHTRGVGQLLELDFWCIVIWRKVNLKGWLFYLVGCYV